LIIGHAKYLSANHHRAISQLDSSQQWWAFRTIAQQHLGVRVQILFMRPIDTNIGQAHHSTMPRLRKDNATTICPKCGAAMVIVKIEPAPDTPNRERHLFRCEVCEETAEFYFATRPE